MMTGTGLEHPDKNVRVREAMTIGERKDAGALDDLLRGLCDDPDFFVRETITWSLMRLGDIAVDPLVALTEDPRARVRHDAIHALSKVGHDRAAMPVWLRLWDEDPVVVAKAAYTLGVFRERGAAPELAGLLVHDVPEVRTSAVEALERLGVLALDALQDVLASGDREGRKRAADVLSSIDDPRAVDALADGLGDEAWDVRVAVLMALSTFVDPRAVAAIQTAAADDDRRVRVLADHLSTTQG